ncbi:MAG: phage late control D family protein [Spirochaetales bacterium]|nr:phage late control D family protein [Spirochaetales bacterium]
MGDNETKNLTPCFIIYINGTRLSGVKEASVKHIVIDERIDMPSTFTVTLSDASRQLVDSEDFSDGSELKIHLGYKDDVEEIISGIIVGVNPQYRKNADDILVVRGKNGLHSLFRGKKTRAFNNVTDADIIRQIADECGLGAEIDDLPHNHLFTMQYNQTDYDYIMAMARNYNCRVNVCDKKLIFKRMEDSSGKDIILEWGKTLLEFSVQTDTNSIVTEVEVRGWDNDKGESVVGTATVDDLNKPFDGDILGGKLVKDNFGDVKMVVVADDIPDQNEARNMALDILSGNAMNYVKGLGKSEGNYNIKAGSMVILKEVGTRFSGKYYVNRAKHVFTPETGYLTYFHISRNTT